MFPLAPVFAQETDPGLAGEGRYHEYSADADMQIPSMDTSLFTKGFQYGGWISPVFAMDRQSGSKSLTSSINTLRLWIKAPLWQNSYLYVRGKDVLMGTIQDKGYSVDNVDNYVDLDMAYLSMSDGSKNLWFSMGRKYFRLGTGLVLNDRGDGVQGEFYSPYGNIVVFGMYTGLLLEENNPYNLQSGDIADSARRFFTGLTYSLDVYNTTVYAIGMAQIDIGKEEKDTTGNKIYDRYQSQYWGLGARGTVLDSLTWYIEGFGETGKSYISGTSRKANILAFGGTAGTNYYLRTYMKPVIQFQYAYGSGDKSRNDQKTPNSNTSGRDTSFVTFGSFSGGSGLRPDLVNLHVFRLGGSALPLDGIDVVGKLMFIAKYSIYLKDRNGADIWASGGSLDTNGKRFVGQGLDTAFRWQLYSDLGFYVSYGLFIPGSALASSEDPRHFLVGGASVSF